ncbi:AraC family transcriptional regulator [Polaribacter porphyrae]|uniref:HTH araC/xylS-type domain-containing protein n=1 Tax=Polaribacter porphyrae TaxID=1137780 RepID=A0A2S7WQL2_9FLAO|nr:helix-turn-helix domain-containing protein [Polaribacter porphyrae]PQJ79889.1 hypothetical protein BTO18_12210 [Polaribacter porphyrae]
MLNVSLSSAYEINSQGLNFKITRLEDLLKLKEKDVINSNHSIDYYTLIFITADIGRHSIDYNDYYYSRGTILSIRKNQIQKFYNNKNARGFSLFFREEFLNSYLNETEIRKTIQAFNEMLTSPKTQLNDEQFSNILLLITKIEEEVLTISDDYSNKIIRSLVHVLITAIYRIKSEGHNKVQLSKYLKEFIKFQNLLENNYTTTKKVGDYSKKLGFSSKKLNTVVQFVTHKSAKKFIDEVIIIKVKKNLLHTSLSIKEIAFKLGFRDPANLYKYFKKHTNYTPEAYRKRFKT